MPKHQRMVMTINTFSKTADDIYNNHFRKSELGYYIPMLVNAAFAIEISLKYLIKYEQGKCNTGHRWIDFWNEINPHYKNVITMYMNDVCQNKYNIQIIDNNIEKHSLTFQELRYSYEKQNVGTNPKFILEFMYALVFTVNCRYESTTNNSEEFMLYCLSKMRGENKIEIQLQNPTVPDRCG